MGVTASVTSFDKDGKMTGFGGNVFLPPGLDWMPIDVKVFWFLDRRFGEPSATHVLFGSQGEQRLITLETPLSNDHKLMKERQNGYEKRIDRFIDEGGYSRTPRNQ